MNWNVKKKTTKKTNKRIVSSQISVKSVWRVLFMSIIVKFEKKEKVLRSERKNTVVIVGKSDYDCHWWGEVIKMWLTKWVRKLIPEVRWCEGGAKPVFSSSHSGSSTVGTVCPRKKWMQRQLTRSRDVWREGVGTRWTFLKTDSLQVQLAAWLLIYIYRRLVTTWGRPKWVQLHLVNYLVSSAAKSVIIKSIVSQAIGR